MAVDSTGLNNPFANPYASLYGNYATSGLNDDFMANAYGICQNDATRVAQNPAFTGNYNLAGQPATDTFQRSSGLVPAAALGLTAGGATTAGLYYLADDKINPYKDGKFDDKLLKSLEDPKALENKIEQLRTQKVNDILAKKSIDSHQFEAIKEFAKTGTKPASVTIPAALTQAEAKAMVEELEKEIKGLKLEDIAKEARRTSTLDGSVSYLNELYERKAKLADLPKDITEEGLAKHLKENAKFYGIEAADEAAIKTAAETEAKKGLGTLISENAGRITTQESHVSTIRTGLESKILPHYDTAKNVLHDGAPESVAKAFKNYKFTKAGKWGLAAAAVGAVFGWICGK